MAEADTSAEHSLSHFVDRAECFAQLELLVDASDGEVARTAQEALSLVVRCNELRRSLHARPADACSILFPRRR